MASPTSRLLELLELLQARPLTTGREIADRLGIDPRTARRYIDVYERLTGTGEDSSEVSLWIWLAGTAIPTTPAVGNFLKFGL